MLLQPLLHLRMLVGCIIVRDDVNRQKLRCFTLYLFEETQPFDMGVAGRRSRDELAFQIVQCGKQGDCSMSLIVVRPGANVPDSQRQSGLRPLQCLALALFVATLRPSRPFSSKRFDQIDTVLMLAPTVLATSTSLCP
jgi:hypothetical protein